MHIEGENWGVLSGSCPYTKAKASLRKVGCEPTGTAALPAKQMDTDGICTRLSVEQLKRPLLLYSNQVKGEPCRQSPRGPPFTLGLGSFQLFWRRVLRGTAYLQCNCSVVVGVRPN